MTAREQKKRVRSLQEKFPGLSVNEVLEFDTAQEVTIQIFDNVPGIQRRASTPLESLFINSIECAEKEPVTDCSP